MVQLQTQSKGTGLYRGVSTLMFTWTYRLNSDIFPSERKASREEKICNTSYYSIPHSKKVMLRCPKGRPHGSSLNCNGRYKIMVKHCCELMTDFLADERVLIFYSEIFREYYIPLRTAMRRKGVLHWTNKFIVCQCIFYCPWCGIKLPESFRDQYFDLLTDEEVDDPPEEFQSDAWWKNRNL